ncbi:hypothetical protein EV421DRAFT_1907242 [Armillaria borealis]|uniref:Uncharacterized protein n=1 Tax=Armillaria borealis TaxID=47425 RepID=A0AA39J8N3_9AGAR|nr:hypothetical protein EV421DRAFT_1907242 [Armillaria borealis]
MTPDNLTITIPSAIGGACLLILLTMLLVLRYREQLEWILQIQRYLRSQAPTPFPLHYVIPYAEPIPRPAEQVLEPIELEEVIRTNQRRRPTSTSSSDEFPLHPREPRNAVPGPSNVPRTPSPSTPVSASTLERNLRADREIELPPDYTPMPIPRGVPIQLRGLIPAADQPHLWILIPCTPFPTCPAPIQPLTPRPFPPDDSSDEDSDP